MAADTSTSSTTSPTAAPATNPRGIPTFPFMTSVTEYVQQVSDVEPTLRRFSEMISKYTFMQQNVEKRAQGLREKLPEMRNTLDTVRFLKRRKETPSRPDDREPDDGGGGEKNGGGGGGGTVETTFPLSDTLYARAVIAPGLLDSVYLWLGANVMVAYPLDEAAEMLGSKLKKARESLQAAEEDLEFLRVQITTLEVATARVYNWDVGEKRRLKAEGKLPDAEESGKDEEG